MANITLTYLPGEQCWVRGQDRVCIIESISIEKNVQGELEITYNWYNLDFGVDITEVWDDGYFTEKNIGKTVFNSYEELVKAFPEDFEYLKEYVDGEF